MDQEPFTPVIRSQADLERAWTRLMGPWGYGSPSVWMLLILGDDRPLPQIVEIAETDFLPDEDQVRSMAGFLDTVAQDLGSAPRFAFLRSRPGGPYVTDRDRGWAEALYGACRLAGVQCEMVHLGTDGCIRPLPPDELSLPSSA